MGCRNPPTPSATHADSGDLARGRVLVAGIVLRPPQKEAVLLRTAQPRSEAFCGIGPKLGFRASISRFRGVALNFRPISAGPAMPHGVLTVTGNPAGDVQRRTRSRPIPKTTPYDTTPIRQDFDQTEFKAGPQRTRSIPNLPGMRCKAVPVGALALKARPDTGPIPRTAPCRMVVPRSGVGRGNVDRRGFALMDQATDWTPDDPERT